MDNLYYNAGFGTFYIRLNGSFYIRSLGKGWRLLTDNIPDLSSFSPMPEPMLQTFWSQLKEDGVVSGEYQAKG